MWGIGVLENTPVPMCSSRNKNTINVFFSFKHFSFLEKSLSYILTCICCSDFPTPFHYHAVRGSVGQ